MAPEEINYITVLKHNFPKNGITSYTNGFDYNSIVFSQNGEPIPSKPELDALIAEEKRMYVIGGSGENIRTFFLPIYQNAGNSIIPLGSSKPTSSQGTQIQTISIIPTNAQSKFSFSGSFIVDCSVKDKIIVFALFRDGVCFYTAATELTSVGRPNTIAIEAFDAPNTLNSVQYSLRIGVSSNAVWYLDQTNSGADLGGTMNSVLKISEYA